jgi:hypothetical protein
LQLYLSKMSRSLLLDAHTCRFREGCRSTTLGGSQDQRRKGDVASDLGLGCWPWLAAACMYARFKLMDPVNGDGARSRRSACPSLGQLVVVRRVKAPGRSTWMVCIFDDCECDCLLKREKERSCSPKYEWEYQDWMTDQLVQISWMNNGTSNMKVMLVGCEAIPRSSNYDRYFPTRRYACVYRSYSYRLTAQNPETNAWSWHDSIINILQWKCSQNNTDTFPHNNGKQELCASSDPLAASQHHRTIA